MKLLQKQKYDEKIGETEKGKAKESEANEKICGIFDVECREYVHVTLTCAV